MRNKEKSPTKKNYLHISYVCSRILAEQIEEDEKRDQTGMHVKLRSLLVSLKIIFT
jgi:hypothetical protein